MRTNAENCIKVVQTNCARGVNFWPKFQILTVLGLYSHISFWLFGPAISIWPYFVKNLMARSHYYFWSILEVPRWGLQLFHAILLTYMCNQKRCKLSKKIKHLNLLETELPNKTTKDSVTTQHLINIFIFLQMQNQKPQSSWYRCR